MCLGSGRSSKPALAQRTLPAEGTRPADESTTKNPVEPLMERLGQGIDQRAKTKNYDDIDNASPTTDTTTSMTDIGINY
tara:strand:+ start:362 stop:598 length:237 start_codon:yes stop_codon:yes gene_type:complete